MLCLCIILCVSILYSKIILLLHINYYCFDYYNCYYICCFRIWWIVTALNINSSNTSGVTSHIMETFAGEKWTVTRLKAYLKSKGIPCSGYTKSQLVELVKKLMSQPDLAEDIGPNDNEATDIERRTVIVSGQKVICPLPSSLTGWDNDLRTIPYITSAHCMMYLMIKKGWSASRIASYEKEQGYLLYMEKHIQNVRLRRLDFGDIFCIRASCTRQTRQNEQPYDVWLFVASNGDIQTAGCQCIG